MAIENDFGESYLTGDANLDGSVDVAGLNALGLNWQQPAKVWSEGNFAVNDLGAPGMVDATDLASLAINWRRSIPRRIAAVPEPTGCLLVICAGFAMGRIRRSGAGKKACVCVLPVRITLETDRPKLPGLLSRLPSANRSSALPSMTTATIINDYSEYSAK